MASQSQANLPPGKGGKPDPKKDNKAAPKKGQVVEDKNAPKSIAVDYPECPHGLNYHIYEKNFA